MKGTRLYSAPRSPLIGGHSRRERSFSSDWLAGAFLGLVASAVGLSAYFADKGASAATLTAQVFVPALLGSVVGGALGTGAARAFGWHPRWVSAAVTAAAFGVAAIAVTVAAGIQIFGA